MFLKKAEICANLAELDLKGCEFLSEKEVLLLLEFWDGGTKEGCLFLENRNGEFVLQEYVAPYLTHDAELTTHALKNTENAVAILNEVEAFCEKRYTFTEKLTFAHLAEHETILNYLK